MQLTPKIIAFIERNLAIEAAASSPDFVPCSARAYAAKVEGERIKLFVERKLGGELIQNLLSSNRIAVVFCLPENEQAIQIKGTDIQLAPVAAEDLQRIRAYARALLMKSRRLVTCARFSLHILLAIPVRR